MDTSKASRRLILLAALTAVLVPSVPQLQQPVAQSGDDAAQADPMPVVVTPGFSSRMPVIRSFGGARPVPMPRIKLPEVTRRDDQPGERPPVTAWRELFDGSRPTP